LWPVIKNVRPLHFLPTAAPAFPIVGSESGAKATAVQTLRDVPAPSSRAKRLDCARFTAAFPRAPIATKLPSAK
jgi:hypothetical protein